MTLHQLAKDRMQRLYLFLSLRSFCFVMCSSSPKRNALQSKRQNQKWSQSVTRFYRGPSTWICLERIEDLKLHKSRKYLMKQLPSPLTLLILSYVFDKLRIFCTKTRLPCVYSAQGWPSALSLMKRCLMRQSTKLMIAPMGSQHCRHCFLCWS